MPVQNFQTSFLRLFRKSSPPTTKEFNSSKIMSTRGLILLTGGNGFIGSWVCKILLESGYPGRAAVRTTAKGEALRNLFSDHGSNLEIALVPDHLAVSLKLYGNLFSPNSSHWHASLERLMKQSKER